MRFPALSAARAQSLRSPFPQAAATPFAGRSSFLQTHRSLSFHLFGDSSGYWGFFKVHGAWVPVSFSSVHCKIDD
jgi:hypothetical protein